MDTQPAASDAQLWQQFGKSRAELIRLADAHTRAVQAWLASRSPQAVRFQGKGVRVAATGLGVPLLNLALGCHFPPHTPAEQIDEEIGEVVAFFQRQGTPWLWWMGPQTTPADVTPFLQRHGIPTEPRPLPAMIAPIALPPAPDGVRADVQVWRARTEADLQAASEIRRLAFRFPPGAALDYFEAMPASWLASDSPAALYLAGTDEAAPAAIGAVITGAGLPGVYIMATRPDQGRRGFGKAVLARLLQHIAAAHSDKTMAVLTASRFGFPLYAQFGFQHLFDYAIYAPAAKTG